MNVKYFVYYHSKFTNTVKILCIMYTIKHKTSMQYIITNLRGTFKTHNDNRYFLHN